jgi:hypothetical protein
MFEIKALVQDMLSLIDFEIHIDHRKLFSTLLFANGAVK